MKNSYRVFDFDDNSMKIDLVELSLSKNAAKSGESGFRIDMTAGSSIPQVARSAGLNIGDLDFLQMYISYNAPFGNGLRLDFGKFVTSMGYEVIEGSNGFNDNYSRSFLFGYAIPFTHTGIKASYSFTSYFSGMIMVVNGWDDAVDNNKSKSVCAQISVLPTSGMNLTANCMLGPEKLKNTSDDRALLDIVGTYSINDLITVGMNADYGTEQHSASNGGSAEWGGVAGYVRLNPGKNFSFSLRGEQFEDRNGVRTGIIQKLREITLTPEFRPTKNFIIRGDLRIDKSDQDVFQKNLGWTNGQTTLDVNVICVF